jgi:hypothetical protein
MTRFRLYHYWGFLSLLIVIMGAAQNTPSGALPTPQASGAAAMELPLQLIAAARQSYLGVTDYSCLFVKREQIHGQLQPDNLIMMKTHARPFSVYLRWLKPGDLAGQEACFATGKNNGMMRAHSTGLVGTVGFVSLDPNDPRCLEHSRHAITEAGIGNLIERLGQRWEFERQLGRTLARSAEFEYDRRRCTRVELIHPDNVNGKISFHRTVVYFDKQTHLPIRIENYDWPKRGSDPNGALIESYSYASLRLNVGVTPATFEH